MTEWNSARAREPAALVEAARHIPRIRYDRVEALRRAIEGGTYRPDPTALARAIVEFEDDFSLRG